MNRYSVVIAGVVIASIILDEAVGGGHYFIGRGHVHEDYSYLSTNYSVRSVVAATTSGDSIIL